MSDIKPLTVGDFRLGQSVHVNADQGIRLGEVTKLGRTRVTVKHPRNQKGDMVERAYPMGSVVVGQQRSDTFGWCLVYADGHVHRLGGLNRKQPYPDVPHIEEERE